MPRIVLLILSFLLTVHLAAQTEVIYNYEGIAYTSKGQLVANAEINMRIRIRNAKAANAVVYEETQFISTDEKGLFFLHIGNMAICGTGNNDRFMKIELAATGESLPGRVMFRCIKCRLCNLRYMPHRIAQKS